MIEGSDDNLWEIKLSGGTNHGWRKESSSSEIR